jgi:hypothetical protein
MQPKPNSKRREYKADPAESNAIVAAADATTAPMQPSPPAAAAA